MNFSRPTIVSSTASWPSITECPDWKGNHFRKVILPNASRGGILGHGSFLTASANGVDTSPVVRGIYVMNKLLDYTPPPPPDDVPVYRTGRARRHHPEGTTD